MGLAILSLGVSVLDQFLEETSPLSLIQGMAGGRCVFGARAAGTPFCCITGLIGLYSALEMSMNFLKL